MIIRKIRIFFALILFMVSTFKFISFILRHKMHYFNYTHPFVSENIKLYPSPDHNIASCPPLIPPLLWSLY